MSYLKILQDLSKNLKNDENADQWAYILARRIEEVVEEDEKGRAEGKGEAMGGMDAWRLICWQWSGLRIDDEVSKTFEVCRTSLRGGSSARIPLTDPDPWLRTVVSSVGGTYQSSAAVLMLVKN